MQLKGRLRAKDLHRRRAPAKGLESLVVEQKVMDKLQQIVLHEKARECLFGSWGFDQDWGDRKGVIVLLTGPPGTGKTAAAEAVAFSVGRPLKLVNAAELLSKWIGESGKNIEAIFEEAQAQDAVLVFDEAEGLFGKRSSAPSSGADRHDTANTGLLLYHLENFKGVCVLCTNLVDQIDQAFFRRLSFQLEFPMPTFELRRKLWKRLLPAEAPLATDVDLDALARGHELPGAQIKQAIFNAGCKAALRQEKRRLEQKDFWDAAADEVRKLRGDLSDSAKMMFH